jgi:hypothetical protein
MDEFSTMATMNNSTSRSIQFVLYSVSELVANDGAGFWSNSEGWVEFKLATRFTPSTLSLCNLPLCEGQDAKWIMWEPRRTVGKYGGQPYAQIPLPLTVVQAQGDGWGRRARARPRVFARCKY